MTFVSEWRFFNVTYNGVPIFDLSQNHPAFASRTAIRGSAVWRDSQAAHAFGYDYDTFANLPVDHRLTMIAQYEINWRVEALQAWERDQEMKLQSRRAGNRTSPAPRRRKRGHV